MRYGNMSRPEVLCLTERTDEQFGRAGETVDKILKGAKPSNLPVEQPTAFELVINLTTRRHLDLKFQKLSSFVLTRSSNRSM